LSCPSLEFTCRQPNRVSEIARRCHVPQATIWRLLNVEDSKPSYKTIQKIWPVLYGDQSGRPLPSQPQDGAA